MRFFGFMCSIILLIKCVVEMKNEKKNENENEMGVKQGLIINIIYILSPYHLQ